MTEELKEGDRVEEQESVTIDGREFPRRDVAGIDGSRGWEVMNVSSEGVTIFHEERGGPLTLPTQLFTELNEKLEIKK